MIGVIVAMTLAQAASGAVSVPYPGVTLVRSSNAALVIADLCHAGVSVRATTYAERKATPSSWAKKASVGAQVAINADFFDFPAATLVVGRARGAGQDWPANKQLFEVRSAWEFGQGVARFQPNAAVAPPAPPAVTEIVGGHNTIIQGGQSLGPAFGDGDPTITNAHRRTAIGMSADRKKLFLFVSNAALTGTQLVATMRAMAAEAGAPAIDVATNVDGGGSSQLYVGTVGPLFETGRLVANHLGILAKGSGPAPNCPVPACQSACLPGVANRVAGAAAPAGFGYWISSANGDLGSFGAATFHGSLLGAPLNQPVVALVSTPTGQGYWLAASDGGVFSFGDAGFYGSAGGSALNAPVVGMARTAAGGGYWLVASDGGVFAYGGAGFHGSMGGQPLNQPVVAMAATPSGGGYWLVASDGGIFAFGNAGFHGSMGGQPLNQPIVGMAATPNGGGYWLVAQDGGIFAFGNAGFHGSMGGQALNQPIVGMAATPSGGGYWLFAKDGGVFSFGDAPFLGSALSEKGCDGTTPLTCVQGANGCYSWQAGAPCAGRCNHGRCEAACSDACAAGDTQCAGAKVQGCGEADSDPCRDWLPGTSCGAGKSCDDGLCVGPQCSDECQIGTMRCDGEAVSQCNTSGAGCGVWGATAACAVGTTCVNGACLPGANPVDEAPWEADVVEPDVVEPEVVEPEVVEPEVVEPEDDADSGWTEEVVAPDADPVEDVGPLPDTAAHDTSAVPDAALPGDAFLPPVDAVSDSGGQDTGTAGDSAQRDAITGDVITVDARGSDGCHGGAPAAASTLWLALTILLAGRRRRLWLAWAWRASAEGPVDPSKPRQG